MPTYFTADLGSLAMDHGHSSPEYRDTSASLHGKHARRSTTSAILVPALHLSAGLRLGEAEALRVVDVDFAPRRIRVAHQVERTTGYRSEIKRPKVGSERVAFMADGLATILKDHIERYGMTPVSCGSSPARLSTRCIRTRSVTCGARHVGDDGSSGALVVTAQQWCSSTSGLRPGPLHFYKPSTCTNSAFYTLNRNSTTSPSAMT